MGLHYCPGGIPISELSFKHMGWSGLHRPFISQLLASYVTMPPLLCLSMNFSVFHDL